MNETRKGLIIYENDGKIVTIVWDRDTVPEGTQGIVADIPRNMKTVTVNPIEKTVTFTVWPNTEDEVANLQNAIIELEARVAELEG